MFCQGGMMLAIMTIKMYKKYSPEIIMLKDWLGQENLVISLRSYIFYLDESLLTSRRMLLMQYQSRFHPFYWFLSQMNNKLFKYNGSNVTCWHFYCEPSLGGWIWEVVRYEWRGVSDIPACSEVSKLVDVRFSILWKSGCTWVSHNHNLRNQLMVLQCFFYHHHWRSLESGGHIRA